MCSLSYIDMIYFLFNCPACVMCEGFYPVKDLPWLAFHFPSVYSTVRTWDVKSEKQHKSVFKPRSFQGKKVVPTCCTYSRDGKLIAAGCQDGTIQIWDRNLNVSVGTHQNVQQHINTGCLFCHDLRSPSHGQSSICH